MGRARAAGRRDGRDAVAERAVRAAAGHRVVGHRDRALRERSARRRTAGDLRHGLLFVALAVVGLLPQMLAWKAIYGTWFAVSPISPQIRLWDSHWDEVLWSSRNGLFAMSPMLYVGALGLLLLWRRDRLATMAALTVVCGHGLPQRRGAGLVGRRRVWRPPLRRDAAVAGAGNRAGAGAIGGVGRPALRGSSWGLPDAAS